MKNRIFKKILATLTIATLFTFTPISAYADYIDDDCKGHDWYYASGIEATCIEDGLAIYYCHNCASYKEEVIPKTGEHEWTEWEPDNHECVEGFYKRSCCNCGKEEVKERKAKAHTWSKWKTELKPTIFDEGYKTRYCGICYETETKKIAKIKTSVSIKSSKKTFKPKKTYYLKLKQSHKEDFDIKWTSSNKKVATVQNGELTTKKKGKTTITVVMLSGAKAKLNITVK